MWSKLSASLDIEAIEQRKDHQRNDALRRCVGVVDHAHGQIELERVAQGGAVANQVLACDRAAEPFEIDRQFVPDIAAIEIVKAGIGEVRRAYRRIFPV